MFYLRVNSNFCLINSMGNADSTLEDAYKLSHFKDLSHSYTHLRTEGNRRFDQAQLYRHNYDPSNVVLVRQAVFISEQASTEFKQRIEAFRHVQCPQVCQLKDYFSTPSSPSDLQQELLQREVRPHHGLRVRRRKSLRLDARQEENHDYWSPLWQALGRLLHRT